MSNLKHHLKGDFHSFLNIFIVSSAILFGSSLYFSWISFNFGWMSLILWAIWVEADVNFMRTSLKIKVIAMIARHKFHWNTAKNIIKILKSGRIINCFHIMLFKIHPIIQRLLIVLYKIVKIYKLYFHYFICFCFHKIVYLCIKFFCQFFYICFVCFIFIFWDFFVF